MSRRNGRPIHANRLVPSSRDNVEFARAVEDKFIHLCGTFRRIRGEDLVPPKSLDADVLRWRTMRVRHKRGDPRHTEAELKSIRAVAEWTLRVNAALRNQPAPDVEWRD